MITLNILQTMHGYDIKIVGDTDNCLMYNFEPNADGLLWNTLVKWWGSAHVSKNIQKDLFKRLLNSLDSQSEKEFLLNIIQYIKMRTSIRH